MNKVGIINDEPRTDPWVYEMDGRLEPGDLVLVTLRTPNYIVRKENGTWFVDPSNVDILSDL